MASNPDPLLNITGGALRVFYSSGRMLNTEDFETDQLYHRSRLAHALSYVTGCGTLSGLNVTEQTSSAGVKELQISPGVAIDRAGRMIDVQATLCIRLQSWLDAQNTSDLSNGFKTANSAIIADIFLGFQQNQQGRTPSFAAGDYDATDAYDSDRWLDTFSAQLVLRFEATPPLPADPWAAAFSGSSFDLNAVNTAILAGQSGAVAVPVEYPQGADETSIFLARVSVPATRANPGDRPAYDLSKPVIIDNSSRLFVYPTSLLTRILKQTQTKS
jgi:hypothetical protein